MRDDGRDGVVATSLRLKISSSGIAAGYERDPSAQILSAVPEPVAGFAFDLRAAGD